MWRTGAVVYSRRFHSVPGVPDVPGRAMDAGNATAAGKARFSAVFSFRARCSRRSRPVASSHCNTMWVNESLFDARNSTGDFSVAGCAYYCMRTYSHHIRVAYEIPLRSFSSPCAEIDREHRERGNGNKKTAVSCGFSTVVAVAGTKCLSGNAGHNRERSQRRGSPVQC